MLIQLFKKVTVLGMATGLVSCTSTQPSIPNPETENPANAESRDRDRGYFKESHQKN